MTGRARACTVESMTSPDRTVPELRHELERLVIDLFEGDRRGVIPALELDRRDDGQLVVYARLPGVTSDEAPMGVEIRLPCGGETEAAQSTPRNAASASMTAPPAAVPATAA